MKKYNIILEFKDGKEEVLRGFETDKNANEIADSIFAYKWKNKETSNHIKIVIGNDAYILV